ncbi:hypothetical protein GCM10010052_34720 [Paenarthrobacter histidinolovorans]|nr:hypothetical protein GCM10010052_34720 [Paenarthrobacter histidinolovorans]
MEFWRVSDLPKVSPWIWESPNRSAVIGSPCRNACAGACPDTARLPHPFPPSAHVTTGAPGENGCDDDSERVRVAGTGAGTAAEVFNRRPHFLGKRIPGIVVP